VPHRTNVYRNGKRIELETSELVVGDIIDLKYGDVIPADVRIVESFNFKVDNSSLTGECKPQRRTNECTSVEPLETKNLAYFSTSVTEGIATGLVIRVGEGTMIGRLATLSCYYPSSALTYAPSIGNRGSNGIANENRHTRNDCTTPVACSSPIGQEMDRFIFIMTMRSLVLGAVFFGLAVFSGYHGMDAIFFIVSIMVANIPEGLSVTFTLVLSLTAKRMAKKNCLVKHLQAVETLGSTSVICSDKTGTITQNKMTVSHVWIHNRISPVSLEDGTSVVYGISNSDSGLQALARVAALCSRARFKPGQEDVPLILK